MFSVKNAQNASDLPEETRYDTDEMPGHINYIQRPNSLDSNDPRSYEIKIGKMLNDSTTHYSRGSLSMYSDYTEYSDTDVPEKQNKKGTRKRRKSIHEEIDSLYEELNSLYAVPESPKRNRRSLHEEVDSMYEELNSLYYEKDNYL